MAVKKFFLLFCVFVVLSFVFIFCLLAVVIKSSEVVARALLLLNGLLLCWHGLLLLYLYLWAWTVLLLHLRARTVHLVLRRASRRRRERPELLRGRWSGRGGLLREHLVEETHAGTVQCRIALIFVEHDVAPRPLPAVELAADGVCVQGSVEGGESARALLNGESLLVLYAQYHDLVIKDLGRTAAAHGVDARKTVNLLLLLSPEGEDGGGRHVRRHFVASGAPVQ